MVADLKFSFKQLQALDGDFTKSGKAIATIVQKVLVKELRPMRNKLRTLIPRLTGKLARSFNLSVKRRRDIVKADFGFMYGKRISAGTAIAGNVLQAGGARPRKGTYLWIPVPSNRAADGSSIQSPREFLAGGGFIATSKAGNRLAFNEGGEPAFVLRKFVKLSRPPVPVTEEVERNLPEITKGIEDGIEAVIAAKRAIE